MTAQFLLRLAPLAAFISTAAHLWDQSVVLAVLLGFVAAFVAAIIAGFVSGLLERGKL